MADDASFPQGLVFENEWPGLLPMTLAAVFVLAGHGQSAPGPENVLAMWIVALNAIHVTLIHRVVLRQAEFGLDLQMTVVASRRIFARVDDELSTTAARLDVFASRSVARFTTGRTLHLRGFDVNARVRTRRK